MVKILYLIAGIIVCLVSSVMAILINDFIHTFMVYPANFVTAFVCTLELVEQIKNKNRTIIPATHWMLGLAILTSVYFYYM